MAAAGILGPPAAMSACGSPCLTSPAPPPFPLPLSRSSPALALAVQLPPELVSGAMMSRSRTPPRRDCYARMLMRARTASDLARIAAHSLFRHELKKRDCEAAALWLSSRGVRAWSQLWQLTPSSVSSLGVSRDAQATVLRAIQLAIECRLDETLGTRHLLPDRRTRAQQPNLRIRYD